MLMMLHTDDKIPGRGDVAKKNISSRRRVSMSACREKGFSLLELVITLTVLTILTMGVMPLVKVSVRRQREQRLRETLREMRLAIQEFHRDTYGMTCAQGTTGATGGIPTVEDTQRPQPNPAGVDPRSKVVITDCKIFTVDNP